MSVSWMYRYLFPFSVQVRPGSWPARRESWVDVARCEIFCTRGHCQPISLRRMNRRCLCAVSGKKGWKRAWLSRETTGSRTADPFSAHVNPCKSLTQPPTPLCFMRPFLLLLSWIACFGEFGGAFSERSTGPNAVGLWFASPPLPLRGFPFLGVLGVVGGAGGAGARPDTLPHPLSSCMDLASRASACDGPRGWLGRCCWGSGLEGCHGWIGTFVLCLVLAWYSGRMLVLSTERITCVGWC